MENSITLKLSKIDRLNLDILKLKLTHKEEGPGWNTRKFKTVEKQYKNFLKLILLYPTASIVPTKEIDTFWHYHILDTQKYFKDSNTIFGTYLHHFPYFGLRDKKDKRNLENAFEQTINLYKTHFGSSLQKASSSKCDSSCKSSCYSKH